MSKCRRQEFIIFVATQILVAGFDFLAVPVRCTMAGQARAGQHPTVDRWQRLMPPAPATGSEHQSRACYLIFCRLPCLSSSRLTSPRFHPPQWSPGAETATASAVRHPGQILNSFVPATDRPVWRAGARCGFGTRRRVPRTNWSLAQHLPYPSAQPHTNSPVTSRLLEPPQLRPPRSVCITILLPPRRPRARHACSMRRAPAFA